MPWSCFGEAFSRGAICSPLAQACSCGFVTVCWSGAEELSRPADGRRDVAALGDFDADGIVLAGEKIVALRAAAQPARLDAHDRVALRVEAVVAIEGSDGDGVGLDPVATSGERLLDDVAQEASVSLRRVEVAA